MMYDYFRSARKKQRASHLRYFLVHMMYKYGFDFDTYIDIGACNSVELDQYCDLFDGVVAFEPNPEAIITPRDNLILHQKALSDREEVRSFHIDMTIPHYSTLNRWEMDKYIPEGHDWKIMQVTTAKLDDYELKASCIKIDTEGEDDAVVRGAINTIAEWKPILYIEFMSQETEQSLIDIGYTVEYSSWIDNFLIHEDYL